MELLSIPADDHAPHPLHAADRAWPETNCYLDLWIELLHALGRDPLPLLGVATALDWEVDHFTFLKPPSNDILAATGVVVHELALWYDLAGQVTAQVKAGAVPLVEVDAYYLPDTRANAYRETHTKTTIAIVGIDPERKRLDYLHNAGRYVLSDDDFAGVLGIGQHRPMLFPFAELARIVEDAAGPAEAKSQARLWLSRNARTRRSGNPIERFATALPELLCLTGNDPARVNALCFNTTRQLGGAFGLFADHLAWLGEDPSDAAWLAQAAKSLQFQIARAARRGRPDPRITASLEEMAQRWARCVASLGAIEASPPLISPDQIAA